CALNQDVLFLGINFRPVFGQATLWTSQFSDAAKWNQPQYYSTIQLADVNGDGKADVCGRGAGGFYCAVSIANAFLNPLTLQLPEFSDANGWSQPQHYQTLWLVDADGDGRADVCGRGTAGILCALSTSVASPSFNPAQLWVSDFGDNNSWGSHDYYWNT